MGQNLHHRINKLEDRAYAGIASATAMASIPSSDESGLGVGVGGFADKHAVAISYQHNLGRLKLKLGASANNEKPTYGAGFFYKFQ